MAEAEAEDMNHDESLLGRIRQLEHGMYVCMYVIFILEFVKLIYCVFMIVERDELRKDIEQLCMQQAGPAYLSVATRMHFQRTAGLELEIQTLQNKLAASTTDILNLQDQLSQAYRIKGQLADLHAAEVSKNMEAEKQLKFFQTCVAAAFSERDHAIIEVRSVQVRLLFI